MVAVIQIVRSASVVADGVPAGSIGGGLYILLGVCKDDEEKDAVILAQKISKLRIFKDENDKMNRSVLDVDGDALVVSNFTLNANYAHGNRPDYFYSMQPDDANRLYMLFAEELGKSVRKVATGVFGANMVSELVTDGPVTIVMDSKVLLGGKK